ncbi:hypothetical protein [Streptomyces reticuliscabiei]|uniref:hypothetical protein n=1 Tax=Streptomyces reticuliscabiei TaxID=146821 RepID=UPI000A3B8616|nr:hypothetical protein [Streptomyces reticuliscabiei]
MTTPGRLAQKARTQTQRIRLDEAAGATSAEVRNAQLRVQQVDQALDRNRAQQDKQAKYSACYPPAEGKEDERAELAEARVGLEREHQYASALLAAAFIAHESVTRERAWLDRPAIGTGEPMPVALLFPFAKKIVDAPGYTITVLKPKPDSPDPIWRETYHGTVSRTRARSILTAWSRQQQTYVLRDAHGRLYVAAPGLRIELVPTDIALPHSKGDALRAALAVYGFTAYDGGEGEFTSLAVSLTQEASEEETYEGPHFLISSGEHADRPASQHDDVWGASLYDEQGEYVTTLDGAPAGSTLAEDCAHIAGAVAEVAHRAFREETVGFARSVGKDAPAQD